MQWFVVAHALHDMVPRCWEQHPGIRQYLTVLYQAWKAIRANGDYHGGALRWLTDLEYLRPRLTNRCAETGHHHPESDRTTSAWPRQGFQVRDLHLPDLPDFPDLPASVGVFQSWPDLQEKFPWDNKPDVRKSP